MKDGQATSYLSLGYLSGNTEGLNLKSGFRADYLQGNYHTFIVGNYKREKKDDDLVVNKGFLHARGIKAACKQLYMELFVQKEFNDFISLEERNVIGTGVRWAPLQKKPAFQSNSDFNLYMGVGMMWEVEEIDAPGDTDTRLLRSTNYLSGNWTAAERVYCYLTGYFQIDTYQSSDFRVLSDAGIQFDITKKLSFVTELNFRYDNEPPESVEQHDLELTEGLQINF